MKLVYVKATYRVLDFIFSCTVLGLVVEYTNTVQDTNIPESPKALYISQKILTPPLVGLQVFLFLFNFFIALYSIYALPWWDRWKKRFEYYRFGAKQKETDGKCGHLLTVIFML